MIYLYLKTHNITGLKYLGKTISDPFKYKGSGKYWKRHLKIHGDDITTQILKECETEEELEKWGLHYSKLWNIVETEEFANFIPENGKSPILNGNKNGMFGKQHSIESKEKNRQKHIGKTASLETKEKMKLKTTERWKNLEMRQKMIENRIGLKRTEETKKKMSESRKGKIISEETKAKMKRNHADFSGQNNPNSKRNRELRALQNG